MIKTALIGQGYWGKIIEQKLDKLSDKLFVQNSKSYNPKLFSEVDWAFVATPVQTHYQIVKDCILQKVNVFVEKPFCTSSAEAEVLIALAKENEVILCVDNVFLFKEELSLLNTVKPKKLKFLWHKDGPFNDNLFNDLLYHDMYLLIDNFGFKKIESLKWNKVEKDILDFEFYYGDIWIKVDYDRTKIGIKSKKIFVDSNLIDFRNGNVDSLSDFIEKCIAKELDFQYLQTLNLQTIILIENINNHHN